MIELLHEECAHAEHPCFADKMRLWRSGGHSPFKAFHPDWRTTTVAEQVRDIRQGAKLMGREDEIAPVTSRWI